MREKIVLAYSGGLDTSVLVRILTVDYGYDVVACHTDVGEAPDHERLAARAKAAGAVACEVIASREEFAEDFCFPALQAHALYQGVYPLSAALSRPLIAKHLVEVARRHGATAVAHGATGKGNDQVRFDLAVKALAPDLKIIAPQRERNLSRDVAMEYAAVHGIEVPTTRRSPYSIDENLWGRSIEGGIHEDPAKKPPEDAFAWTKSWQEAPSEPVLLRIAFEKGRPVAVDGEALAPAALIEKVGAIAGLHGVGRIDLVEDRVVGIKSRELYECPAALTLIAAHQDLERFTCLRTTNELKATLAQRYAQLIYDGVWYGQTRLALQAFNDAVQEVVTGEVTLQLHKGSLRVVGRTSPNGLYDLALSTYDKADRFDHRAAEGMIELAGLPLQLFAKIHGGQP
jgi:argininosuccinate synthase